MLRLATRSSKLAVTQCEGVAERFRHAGFEVELVLIDPAEEKRQPGADDKGRFTRGVERALLEDRAEIGVHSAKDLPGELPEGLILAGAPRRGPASDAWITPESVEGASPTPDGDLSLRERLRSLPTEARVGTASLRRRSQLLALREDLRIEELRGNVDTRVKLLQERELDAIVLASAGLERLGMRSLIEFEISPKELLPAPGQGTLALEVREGDREALAAVQAITCAETFAALRAERAVSAGLEADCDTSIGALAVTEGDRLQLWGYVGSHDGDDWIRDSVEGPLAEPHDLGRRLANRMLASGAETILGR